MTFVADLFTQGSKILFFTGYPMATDNFLRQVGEQPVDAVAHVTKENQLGTNTQAIMLESGNESLYI